MHEFSLMANLLRKIERVARDNDARRVTSVTVRLGALSHISAEHFREHFVEGVRGTVADGASLEVETSDDTADPNAQEILLRRIAVE